MTPAFFNPRARSLVRANLIVIGSLLLATLLSGFPRIHPNAFIIFPALGAIVGMADTMRCIQRRWTLYHGGVILCLYMDLMTIAIILFFLLYPYFLPFTSTGR